MSIATYPLDEIAESFGVTPRWLTDQVRAGRFPARKIGRHWRFTETDVETIFAVCANDFQKPADVVSSIAAGLTAGSRRKLASL